GAAGTVAWVVAAIALVPTPAEQAWDHAAALLRAGQAAQAAADFEQLADRFPDDELADDALFQAAELRGERLGDPEGGLGRHQRMIERYPQSRLLRRTQARIAFLTASLASGAQPLREYLDIVTHYPERRAADSIARMRALLGRAPSFSLAANAWFWL